MPPMSADQSGLPDLAALRLPDDAVAWLTEASRDDEVVNQSIDVELGWWREALATYEMRGGPVTGRRDNELVDTGRAAITRRDLFGLAADAADDDEAALRLLWHTLAWGAGRSARNMRRRLTAVGATPDVARLLRTAGRAATTDPAAGFALLRPGRRSAIAWLGPAFFTKYLYFAGAGATTHPALILDARVARTLRDRCGWVSLSARGSWSSITYRRYCDLVARWAAEQRSPDRLVSADLIEKWLFDHGDDDRLPRGTVGR